MKRICSLLVLSTSIIFSPVIMAKPHGISANIIANPIGVPVDITCPSAQGNTNVITNFGSYIAGYGSESVLSGSNLIYFKSNSLPDDIPRKLTNYFNESADYDSTTGRISCVFASNTSDPRFSIAYFSTNGLGGIVQAQSNNSISIIFPVGIRKA